MSTIVYIIAPRRWKVASVAQRAGTWAPYPHRRDPLWCESLLNCLPLKVREWHLAWAEAAERNDDAPMPDDDWPPRCLMGQGGVRA